MRAQPDHRPRPGQRGAALITSLILLLVMTLLATTTMRNATLEERMAANSAFHQRAFQAAESAAAETVGQPRAVYAPSMLPSSSSTAGDAVDVSLESFEGIDDLSGSAAIRHLPREGSPECGESSTGIGTGMTLQYFEIDARGSVVADGTTVSNEDLTAGVAICGPAL